MAFSFQRRKSFIATSLVQMTRYTWLGYDKHLYFTVIPDRNGNTSLFLSSVADNVEILSFLEATWLQAAAADRYPDPVPGFQFQTPPGFQKNSRHHPDF